MGLHDFYFLVKLDNITQCKLNRTLKDWKLVYETFYEHVIIPSSPVNSWIWPVLKPRKHEQHLTVDRNVEAVVTSNKPLCPVTSIMEITNFIHSASGTHSAIADLAKSALFGQQPLSCHWPSPLKGQETHLPGSPQGTSAPLPLHTVSAGRIWTAFIVLQTQRCDMTMT